MAAGNGSLSCVGMGMMLGAHIGPRARATIEQADVVFGAVSDPIVELWLQQMHPDVRSIQPCYTDGKSRHATYSEMVQRTEERSVGNECVSPCRARWEQKQ